MGKRGVYYLVHGDLPRQHPFGTTLRFTGPVQAASRQAITWPDKLGTDPMAYSGLNNSMDAAAELGRNPVSKHPISSEYGDGQGDAGRDCRARLARPNSQGRTQTGKYQFSLFG